MGGNLRMRFIERYTAWGMSASLNKNITLIESPIQSRFYKSIRL